jgi:MFS family permease
LRDEATFETNIPQRLDRLPWSRWHWRIVAALGVTWVLDGLEVTIVGALGAALTRPETLGLRESEVGLAASAYLAGTVGGAILFARLTDRGGRRRWFLVTLVLYLVATFLTAFAWDLPSFLALRFLTGAGIGGEYAAINSAIDELIPARRRGQVDLGINGSWWLGTLLGALASIPLLDVRVLPADLGWRVCFALGALLGLAVLLVRRAVPESPRWLLTRGRIEEAERIVAGVEAEVLRESGLARLPEPAGSLRLRPRPRAGLAVVARELLVTWPRRSALGFSLMVTQSFLYNAVFFTYALVLARFYGVPPERVGLFLVPFAIGNFCGPLVLGRLFDTLGRRVMVASTYAASGVLLALTGLLFAQGLLTATTQTLLWTVIFFFASAGASSAYLTVSEIFPLEIRATAIACFFVAAQGAGAFAPWVFGLLIESSAQSVFYGNLLGAAMMVFGGAVAWRLGVDAEGRSLEDVAEPLSARSGSDASR